jgi:hypothetical protein
MYITVSTVKKAIKEKGKRSSKEFILALDMMVAGIVEKAIADETEKKTLDANSLPTV